jgi:hypothetical protein
MSKYRFKTQDEFIRDGQWNDEYDCPEGWSQSGDMNHYLGQDVPEGANESCDLGEGFEDDGWWFEPTNYILKEEDYTGRWIKALADNIQSTGVKLGEVIQIIGKPNTYRLDKTSKGILGMSIQCPLNTSEWELVEQPKDNSDDILEEAKRRYPIGTKCKCLVLEKEVTILNHTTEGIKNTENAIFFKVEGNSTKVYSHGEWAEIVKPASSKVVPGYVKCVQKLMNAKVGKIYPVVDEKHCLCEQGNTYEWDSQEFINSTKQEYDAQFSFSNEQDPLYICKQEYRKGMRVISASKTGMYSGEFIIDVNPKEFRNLSGDKDIVDYSCSPGYLYYKGEYAEILEEGVYDVSEIIKTNKPFVDNYLENSGFKEHNPEAYNWLMDKPKPSIESVQSVDVNLRTKKQINKLKF